MIPYVEIIDKYSRKKFFQIEPSQCWFELSYYEMGEFEVYCKATPSNIVALQDGNYVKIPNKPYLWVIKNARYISKADGTAMISAKGYEAKWLTNQRVILQPFNLPTNLATAITKLINDNLGSTASASRKINGFITATPEFNITIEQTQATRENVGEFAKNLLKSNKCGAITTYNEETIEYKAFKGSDVSEAVVFSQSLDNLLSSEYSYNSANSKTFVQVVSTFTNDEEETDYIQEYDLGGTGIDRNELTVQSNLSTKYTDTSGVEQETTPTSDLYKGWQVEEGKNKLAEHIIQKEFSGDIDLEYSKYQFATDFFIGDLVGIRDEHFNIQAKARILKYTFKQDSRGYGEEAEYQSEQI